MKATDSALDLIKQQGLQRYIAEIQGTGTGGIITVGDVLKLQEQINREVLARPALNASPEERDAVMRLLRRIFRLYGAKNRELGRKPFWVRSSSAERHQFVHVQAWWTGRVRPWYFPFKKISKTKLRDLTESSSFDRIIQGQEVVLTKVETIYALQQVGPYSKWGWEERDLGPGSRQSVHNFQELLDYGRRNLSFLTETQF